jgi:hypothetical protein
MGEVAALKTPCMPQEVVGALAAVWPWVVNAPLTLATACVLAAQSAIETNEWKSCVQYNLGNFKWDGKSAYCQFPTYEYVGGVRTLIRPPEPGCQFMAYADLQTGVRAWVVNLSRRWTLAWPCALAGDPDGFAQGLHDQKPPYYTAPPAEYIAGMRRYFDPFMTFLVLPTADTDPPGPLPET